MANWREYPNRPKRPLSAVLKETLIELAVGAGWGLLLMWLIVTYGG